MFVNRSKMKVSCLLVGAWHRPEGLGFTRNLVGSVPASPQWRVPRRKCFIQSDGVACIFVVLVVLVGRRFLS